jgi:transposase-like protein
MTEKEWQSLIRKARGLILKEKGHQFKVAAIAIEACCINHGGDRNRRFTVAKFANAVGINRKTLYQWIRYKRRIIDKLPVKTKIDEIPLEVLANVDKRIGDTQSPKQIKIILDEEWGKGPLKYKWAKYLRVLGTILHNANTPIKLMEVEDQTIEDVVKVCTTITNVMGLELNYRKNGTYGAKEKAQKQVDRFTAAVRTLNEK